MQRADEAKKHEKSNYCLWGPPKDAGKTTLAMSAPGTKLVLKYDTGLTVIPPGIDPTTVWVEEYPCADPGITLVKDGAISSSRWERTRNIGEKIILDLLEIRNAYLQKRDINLSGHTCPLVDNLILDGGVQLSSSILDWVLALDRKNEPDEYDNSFTPWSKRLNKLNTLMNMILPLPCSVWLITWETNVSITEKNPTTGKLIVTQTKELTPDFGGKLDIWAPGKVDVSLYCFSRRDGNDNKYYVQTKKDELKKHIGVRDVYDLPVYVDVTIDPKRPITPFEKIFVRKGK